MQPNVNHPHSFATISLSLFFLFCFPVLLLQGCATVDESVEPTEKEIYESASRALKSHNFNEASRQLELLESRYPFGRHAEQAQLDLIYARFSSLDIDGALIAADRFIRLHPDSEHVDYAYYIRGVANFNYDQGLSARWFSIDQASRDPGRMRESYNDFRQLVTRFPDSDYAADSRQRMIAIRNRLADHELGVIRYYILREAYIAAVNRCRYVVDTFPNTPATEEALILMVELYRQLGQKQFASDALVILAANYPDSKAFDKNMKFRSNRVMRKDRSLTRLLDFDMFDGF
ncbi:MAG: outer membrane protein assembly factor BamD [Proteobacteria bacterium]|nr:MAG: outer membrane protein assembly factor BamD [Pseudomonadota bacterium]